MPYQQYLNLLQSHPVTFVTGLTVPMAAGVSCRMHTHAETELVLHAEGGSGITAAGNGRKQTFAPGSLVLYPANQPHDQRMHTGGVEWCVLVRLPDALAGLASHVRYLPKVDDLLDPRQFAVLAGHVPPFTPLQQYALNCQATGIIAALLPVLLRAPREATAATEVERAIAILRREYHRPLYFAEVAEEVGLSESYLRHLFTAHTGRSPVQWLLDIRVTRAKELLQHTALPQKEIAKLCGFGAEGYFSRMIRRETGITPGAYRRLSG